MVADFDPPKRDPMTGPESAEPVAVGRQDGEMADAELDGVSAGGISIGNVVSTFLRLNPATAAPMAAVDLSPEK